MRLGKEAKALWANYFDGRSVEARNRLIEHYRPLVHIQASRMAQRLPAQISYDEICSAGYDGLMEAVERFDPSTGFRFETFCGQRIHGAVIDWLRELDGQSRTVRAFEKKRTRVNDEIKAIIGRAPTPRESAFKMGITEERYAELAQLSRIGHEVHISAIGKDDDNSHRGAGGGWDIRDHRSADPSDRQAAKSLLARVTAGLNCDERMVITLYYIEEMRMEEIGVVLGLSESRVSQIHKDVIAWLRESASLRAEVAPEWRACKERMEPEMFEGDDKGLENFVSELDERAQRIITRKHDLDGQGAKKVKDIAADEGITKEYVYQIASVSMSKLRTMRERASGKRPEPKKQRALAVREKKPDAQIAVAALPEGVDPEAVIADLEARRLDIDNAINSLRWVYGLEKRSA